MRKNLLKAFDKAEVTEDDMLVQKAAQNFQKALGDKNGEVIHELYNTMRKR